MRDRLRTAVMRYGVLSLIAGIILKNPDKIVCFDMFTIAVVMLLQYVNFELYINNRRK